MTHTHSRPTDVVLSVSDLTIWRRDRRPDPLVADLSFSLREGAVLALIGPSGVGKSSVLNAIAGFIPGDGGAGGSIWDWQDEGEGLRFSGRIVVDGTGIDRTPVERRREIGMVMQGGLVYEHLTVLENVTFPLKISGVRSTARLRAQGISLLQEADLLTADASHEETNDLLRQKAGKLSGGQRQRLAIARVLAKSPRVFLLDEAFANLDPILRAELFEQVVQMVRATRKCAVIVTHDLSDLELVDDVILLGQTGSAHRAAHRFYRREGTVFIGEDGPLAREPVWANWDKRIRKP